MSQTAREAPERPLGAVSLLALGVNGIVGVGIFFVPADVAARAPGLLSVAVFAGTAIGLLPVALTFSTLARRFDEDGGPVLYARAAYGALASFAVGWIAYVSAIASTAAVCVGLVRAAGPALGISGPIAERIAATSLVSLLAIVCAAGLSLSARVWTVLTILKLLPLLALAGAGLFFVPSVPVVTPAVPVASLLAAGLTVTFSYQGFEIVPIVAGQARASARIVPFAVVGSLAISGVLYVTLSWICARALPGLATSEAPLADAAMVVGGSGLAWLVRVGTSVSALGIAVGMVAMTPRYLSALAARGGLGMRLDQVAPNGVPRRAMAVTWVLVVALIQAGSRAELFALSSLAVLAQYVVTALALLTLSSRQERGLSLRHAWPAVPALLVGLALASRATIRECAVAGVALAIGAALRLASRGSRLAA